MSTSSPASECLQCHARVEDPPQPDATNSWPALLGGDGSPYRFFFFSSDGDEPPHVHVGRDDMLVKLWSVPIREAYNHGFKPNELNRIVAIARESEEQLLKAWHEYFNRNVGSSRQKR